MGKGGKQGALEEGGEERREGSTGARRRGSRAWGMGKGGKQRALGHGGEERREHWSTGERIKSLGDGKMREAGSTGVRRRGEKGALEHGGEDQEHGRWENEGSREHWSTEERREGSTGAWRRGSTAWEMGKRGKQGPLEHRGGDGKGSERGRGWEGVDPWASWQLYQAEYQN